MRRRLLHAPKCGNDIDGGPTKVLCSVARLPTSKSIAQLLNQRLLQGTLESEEGLSRLVALLKGFRNPELSDVQFNTVSTKTLLEAQQNPQKFRDLAWLFAAGAGVAGSVVDDSGHALAAAHVLTSYASSVKAPVAAPPVITGPPAATVTAGANGIMLKVTGKK